MMVRATVPNSASGMLTKSRALPTAWIVFVWYNLIGVDKIHPHPHRVPGAHRMPLVPMRTLLDRAAENGYGVAAFNVNNMEQIQAIMEAADETDSPASVQASSGARNYSQDH